MSTVVFVLAAGKGTRMNSDLPKVLHEIGGRPMILYSLDILKKLDLEDIFVLTGHREEEVISKVGHKVKYIKGASPLGTGFAIKHALDNLGKDYQQVLVVNGDDSAFYKPETLREFINFHNNSEAVISIITTKKPQDQVFGRIIRDNDGNFEVTMEDKEYRVSGLLTDEINCGAYVFDFEWLKENINRLEPSPNGEYRITELLNMAHQENFKVGLFELEDSNQWVGVNTPEELMRANEMFAKQK